MATKSGFSSGWKGFVDRKWNKILYCDSMPSCSQTSSLLGVIIGSEMRVQVRSAQIYKISESWIAQLLGGQRLGTLEE
jgi:hypothetical protein